MSANYKEDHQKKHANPAVVSAIAGLAAASIGKSIMHPIDTIKAKLQVMSIPGHAKPSIEAGPKQSIIMQLAGDTVKAEGVRGLYKGFGIHVLGSIPAGGLYFGSYELFKKLTL